MKQTVILKSNASGITLVLDDKVSFEQILEDTLQVFKDNADFFENSRFAIAFTGRTLTEDEEIQMVLSINENTNAKVIRLISNDEALEQKFMMRQLEFEHLIANNTGKFHKGSLKDKDVLETEASIIILGDVQEGAKVISKGNVIVLGTLKGNVYAGAGGNEESFVAALIMQPSKLRIAYLTYSNERKKFLGRKSNIDKQPQVAKIQGGRIEVSPLISK